MLKSLRFTSYICSRPLDYPLTSMLARLTMNIIKHHLKVEMNAAFLISTNEMMLLFLLNILPTVLIMFYGKNEFKKIKMDCSRQMTSA